MAEISNFTTELARAEAFLRAKCRLISTTGLSIHIKYTRAKRRDITGYYRFADRRIVIAVKRRLRYPRKAAYGVGSLALAHKPARGRPYKLVWHEEQFDSADELLAFVAGHEIWHFLCHSGQRKGNHETKANCNGFLWLREFKSWSGPGVPVETIPPLPPRPDMPGAFPVLGITAPSSLPNNAHAAEPTQTTPANARRPSGAPATNADVALAALPGALARGPAQWVQRELFSDASAYAAPAPRQQPSLARRDRRRGRR